MATTINKKQLFDALSVLKDNVMPSDLAECSNYAIFHNNRICAMNDSVAVSVPMFSDVPNCAVELQLLYDFVRKMADKEIIIGMANGGLKLKGKNSVAEFAVRDDILFDDALINLDNTQFSNLPETFAEALNFTGFATDETEAAYSRCVINDGAMYALSSFRCAKYSMGESAKEAFPQMTFVSPSCMSFVNKMRPTKYLVSDGYIHLYDNDMRIYSARTRTDTNFPIDLAENFISVPSTPEFRLPSSFSDVLDRANPFSGKTAKVKKVTIDINNNVLSLVAVREDGSRYKEAVQGVPCSEHINFSVNLKLLSDMVKLVEVFRIDDERLVGTAPMYVAMSPLCNE